MNFVVTDRHGTPLARIKAESVEQADGLALRKIVGAARLVEVRTMSTRDIERRLVESFKALGLSDASAKVAAAGTNVRNLREYEAPSPERSSNDPNRFVDRYANPEHSLYESFEAMGVPNEVARVAAEGRR